MIYVPAWRTLDGTVRRPRVIHAANDLQAIEIAKCAYLDRCNWYLVQVTDATTGRSVWRTQGRWL